MGVFDRMAQILQGEIPLILDAVDQIFDDNDKFASGETGRRMFARVDRSPIDVGLELYGPEWIDYTLFGRNKGLPPPIAVIEAWIIDRGLDLDPFAVQRNIELSGTVARDFGFFDQLEEIYVDNLLPRLENERTLGILLEDLTQTLLEGQQGFPTRRR